MRVSEVAENMCTGCGCCENVCLTDAIKMRPNREGFLFPRIDERRCIGCSKCFEKCPAMESFSEKNETPELYAIRAREEISAKSSAGGVFSLLAQEVLAQGGYVCGAAFNSSFRLSHRLAGTQKDAEKFHGSKYLQSDTGLIYREIEVKLKTGKPMLFTGCPCQVAALYSFLGHDFNNLFTADLLCRGVPSQQLFDLYLNEISGDRKISDIRFRDKKYGWTSNNICIDFEDLGSYEGDIKSDPYEKAFHTGLMLRKSCFECKFSTFPRYGDITMGDFWGIEKLDKGSDGSDATSLVFVNSSKGSALIKRFASLVEYQKKLEFEPKKINNRIFASTSHNKSRERFFKLLNNNSFRKSVDMASNGRYDIGLVGIYAIENFGGALSYFALYNTLEDMGFSTVMIERPKTARLPAKPLSLSFETDPYPKFALAEIYKSKAEMECLNDRCELFITGSDQLLNNHLYNSFGQWITLDWVSDNKKKLAYSASFGHDSFWGNEQTRAKMSYFMKKFDAFSVREKSGVELAKNTFGIDAEFVLDPVFLCGKNHYERLANASTLDCNVPYIGGYILDPDREKEGIIKCINEHFSLPLRLYSELHCTQKQALEKWDLPIEIEHTKFESRLKSIINCEFFITDSFHGICFAVIFKKQFAAILNKKRGQTRMTSLLSLLGLEDRLICDGNFPYRLLEKIDYSNTEKILEREVKRCKTWLYDAITSKQNKPYSDYDILKSMINLQNAQIKALTEQNKNLTSSLAFLLKREAMEFMTQTDIIRYLTELERQKSRFLIIISVKDTPGHYLDGEISKRIISLGFETDLQNKHWHSYIGIIYSGTVMFETIAKQDNSSFYGEISGIVTEVLSKPLNQGNESKIMLGGVDYSVNKRGLNFVIYDNETGVVVDSRCFDTHSAGIECTRKPPEIAIKKGT